MHCVNTTGNKFNINSLRISLYKSNTHVDNNWWHILLYIASQMKNCHKYKLIGNKKADFCLNVGGNRVPDGNPPVWWPHMQWEMSVLPQCQSTHQLLEVSFSSACGRLRERFKRLTCT